MWIFISKKLVGGWLGFISESDFSVFLSPFFLQVFFKNSSFLMMNIFDGRKLVSLKITVKNNLVSPLIFSLLINRFKQKLILFIDVIYIQFNLTHIAMCANRFVSINIIINRGNFILIHKHTWKFTSSSLSPFNYICFHKKAAILWFILTNAAAYFNIS